MQLNRQQGFSLLEVALAIVLLGLTVVWLLGPGAWEHSQSEHEKGRRQVEMARDFLRHYLKINHFLPCPDTDGDGLENRDGNDNSRFCSASQGRFPYREVGLPRNAGYDRLFYAVLPGAADPSAGQNNVHDVCQAASVFGRSGNGVMTNLYQNPDSLQYFCGYAECAASLVSSAACTPILTPAKDPRKVFTLQPHLNSPPYFHMFTPPVGSWSVAGMLKIYDPHQLNTATDDELLEEMAVAVILHCPDGVCMAENTDGDVKYYFPRSDHAMGADQLRWINLYEAKRIMIDAGIY